MTSHGVQQLIVMTEMSYGTTAKVFAIFSCEIMIMR